MIFILNSHFLTSTNQFLDYFLMFFEDGFMMRWNKRCYNRILMSRSLTFGTSMWFLGPLVPWDSCQVIDVLSHFLLTSSSSITWDFLSILERHLISLVTCHKFGVDLKKWEVTCDYSSDSKSLRKWILESPINAASLGSVVDRNLIPKRRPDL